METEYIKVIPELPSRSNSSVGLSPIGDNPQQEDDIEKINGGGENSLKMKLYNLLKELSENEII